jgi:hypothetical protein
MSIAHMYTDFVQAVSTQACYTLDGTKPAFATAFYSCVIRGVYQAGSSLSESRLHTLLI